jgi:hypothetical protein
MNGKTVGVAMAFLIVVRVTQGVWEFYWAKNLKKITAIVLATSQLKTKSRFFLSLKLLTFIVARDKVI